MASVLGRITTSEDSPRGPDVKHRIRVKQAWFDRGDTIEFELPRNLACAKCDGGGCDTCAGAGALSLRDRKDAPETVRVILPGIKGTEGESRRAIALRIPEKGGVPTEDSLPRGMLILTVVAGEQSDPGVRKTHPSLAPLQQSLAKRLSIQPEPGGVSWPVVTIAAVVIWVLLLMVLRAAGVF